MKKDQTLMIPFPPSGEALDPETSAYLGQLASKIGIACAHEWVIRLPARSKLPAHRVGHITWPMLLAAGTVRFTCRHCPAWLEMKQTEDGQLYFQGERHGPDAGP